MANKALLVGINTYPGAPLNGCVNDVKNIADILVTMYGWNRADIRMITDNDGTKANIMAGIAWLCQCSPGDKVVYYFSGHGSQIADVQGFVRGLSDMECPVDLDWTPQTMILDHELFDAFAKIPAGVQFNWCSDSCHSGDLTREFPHPSGKYPVSKHKFMAPPVEMQAKVDAAVANGCQTRRAVSGPHLIVGFISGCKSNQTSADAFIDNTPCGAFTYYFTKNLKANRNRTVFQLASATMEDLAANGYVQQPVAEGTLINRAFLADPVRDEGDSGDVKGNWYDMFLPWKWFGGRPGAL